ncbi:MAG TPA: ribonuclease P protein component [candidate division Zixibacteria bacterium]|nr:ribonuclease P protein component [candidate division Zixibacteria bacterium]
MHRALRLRSSADFDKLRQSGRRWHHPMILLIVGPNDLEQSRFGFSASRRFGNAASRNRIKRILREVVRSHLVAIENGWDCLFVARLAANGATYSEIEAAVNQLLKRSKLLTPFSDLRESKKFEEGLT